MELQPSTLDGIKIVRPAGRIDHASADAFQAALAPHVAQCRDNSPALVLDMSKVDYISSVGLRVLMLAAKQVKSQQGRIAVAALNAIVNEVFEISRVNLVFDIFADVHAAARAHGGRE
jgi:anti-anti-sigma factor